MPNKRGIVAQIFDPSNSLAPTTAIAGYVMTIGADGFWSIAPATSSLGFTPEDVGNKSTNVALGTSNILYPSQKAVKSYVDTLLAGYISGSGTANKLPKFTAGGVIGNSQITDDGINVIVNTTGVLQLGQITGSGNGTSISIDDTIIQITFNGPALFNAGARTDNHFYPNSLALDLGKAANPFRSLYIGGAATNNIQLTGTATGARVATLPDATTKIPIITQLLTFSGPTAARTFTLPDANSSLVPAGLLTASGLTQNTAKLIGRTTAGIGAIEEISIGSGLTLTAGVLSSSVSSGVTSVAGTSPISSSGGTTPAISLLTNVDHLFTASQSVKLTDGLTTNILYPLVITHNTSSTPGAGFGVGISFKGSDSSVDNLATGEINVTWKDSTHSSYTSQLSVKLANNAVAPAEVFRVEGTGRTVHTGPVVLPSYTVATLPSASASGAGALAFVTDATTTTITGLGLAPTGGGTNKVVVYSDGTGWLII